MEIDSDEWLPDLPPLDGGAEDEEISPVGDDELDAHPDETSLDDESANHIEVEELPSFEQSECDESEPGPGTFEEFEIDRDIDESDGRSATEQEANASADDELDELESWAEDGGEEGTLDDDDVLLEAVLPPLEEDREEGEETDPSEDALADLSPLWSDIGWRATNVPPDWESQLCQHGDGSPAAFAATADGELICGRFDRERGVCLSVVRDASGHERQGRCTAHVGSVGPWLLSVDGEHHFVALLEGAPPVLLDIRDGHVKRRAVPPAAHRATSVAHDFAALFLATEAGVWSFSDDRWTLVSRLSDVVALAVTRENQRGTLVALRAPSAEAPQLVLLHSDRAPEIVAELPRVQSTPAGTPALIWDPQSLSLVVVCCGEVTAWTWIKSPRRLADSRG